MKRGNHVKVIDRDRALLERWDNQPKIDTNHGDIRDKELLKKLVGGVDVVFHLASAHLSITTSESEYQEVNVDATKSLVEICRAAGVKRFVHCSSVGVYGEITHPPANEQSPCSPDLIYEKTKLAGERAVAEFHRQTGYPVAIVRPVWVYGPRCPRTAKLFRTIRKGRFIVIGNGQTLRHCIHVSDLVNAFDICASREAAIGQDFIIGDHSAVTVQRLLEEIASIMNVKPPRIRVPINLANPVFAAVETLFRVRGKEPPLSTRTLKFFTNNTSFDISKAKSLLDFRPAVTLGEGLRQTYCALVRQGDV
jgi:nucleoside-diphosphate-sugar epimerase